MAELDGGDPAEQPETVGTLPRPTGGATTTRPLPEGGRRPPPLQQMCPASLDCRGWRLSSFPPSISQCPAAKKACRNSISNALEAEKDQAGQTPLDPLSRLPLNPTLWPGLSVVGMDWVKPLSPSCCDPSRAVGLEREPLHVPGWAQAPGFWGAGTSLSTGLDTLRLAEASV